MELAEGWSILAEYHCAKLGRVGPKSAAQFSVAVLPRPSNRCMGRPRVWLGRRRLGNRSRLDERMPQHQPPEFLRLLPALL